MEGGPYEAAARAHSSVRAGRRLEDGGGGAQDLGDWGPKGTVLRACVMGHTNPHLYEHRPRVSMLLQVGGGGGCNRKEDANKVISGGTPGGS